MESNGYVYVPYPVEYGIYTVLAGVIFILYEF